MCSRRLCTWHDARPVVNQTDLELSQATCSPAAFRIARTGPPSTSPNTSRTGCALSAPPRREGD